MDTVESLKLRAFEGGFVFELRAGIGGFDLFELFGCDFDLRTRQDRDTRIDDTTVSERYARDGVGTEQGVFADADGIAVGTAKHTEDTRAASDVGAFAHDRRRRDASFDHNRSECSRVEVDIACAGHDRRARRQLRTHTYLGSIEDTRIVVGNDMLQIARELIDRIDGGILTFEFEFDFVFSKPFEFVGCVADPCDIAKDTERAVEIDFTQFRLSLRKGVKFQIDRFDALRRRIFKKEHDAIIFADIFHIPQRFDHLYVFVRIARRFRRIRRECRHRVGDKRIVDRRDKFAAAIVECNLRFLQRFDKDRRRTVVLFPIDKRETCL